MKCAKEYFIVLALQQVAGQATESILATLTTKRTEATLELVKQQKQQKQHQTAAVKTIEYTIL